MFISMVKGEINYHDAIGDKGLYSHHRVLLRALDSKRKKIKGSVFLLDQMTRDVG